VSTAINPNSDTIRAALKDAGQEGAVIRIVTGPKNLKLYVSDNPQTAGGIRRTLSPLWSDAKTRIQPASYGCMVEVKGVSRAAALIVIEREGWEQTQPAGQLDTERRARALVGPTCDTEGYPLQYLPRRKGDHEPWAANERTEIRYGNAWVEEWQPVRNPQVAQDEAEALNARELPRRPVAVNVRTEETEREFRTKPGTHVPGRLLAGKCFRRNRRR
jgi:hypothetical protein